ncbi:MAG: arginine--tRNA ligase [Candidatus Pacebacteria bacterium]|nr:arginine--tRNA ligase [Candidatus Paceibacterota bacterium]
MLIAEAVRNRLRVALAAALADHGVVVDPTDIKIEYPLDLSHGDYASGVAMKYAKQAGVAPKMLAEQLVTAVGKLDGVQSIEVAGPGFVNITLTPQEVASTVGYAASDAWGRNLPTGKHILFEYTDPNPFKAFHIGHLMSNTIGESLARLTDFAGTSVSRANYQGDVGVHVACAIWGIRKLGIHPDSADEFGTAYAAGASAYKDDETAKAEIDVINKAIYDRSDPELNALYDTGRKESLAAFEKIYATLGTKFDRYFFESETGPVGKEIVLAHPEVFPESDGARVFKGEEHGLHTRVFISGKGLPTYEAKEIGLEKMKQDEFPASEKFVIVTANEVIDFFRVVKKAMEFVAPEIAAKLTHITHGLMKLPEGKMSSRTGSVVTGESLLNDLRTAALERATESRADDKAKLAEQVAVAAIKFQILKQSMTKDIIFDRERALSLEGDSGPYIQYAHARAHQIVDKATETGVVAVVDERAEPNTVTRLVHRFPEVVESAASLMEPHVVTTYLIELASAYNSWYAEVHVLDGTPAAAHKVAVVNAVRNTLKNGLWILGIPAPEKM